MLHYTPQHVSSSTLLETCWYFEKSIGTDVHLLSHQNRTNKHYKSCCCFHLHTMKNV